MNFWGQSNTLSHVTLHADGTALPNRTEVLFRFTNEHEEIEQYKNSVLNDVFKHARNFLRILCTLKIGFCTRFLRLLKLLRVLLH